jgi:hypothetical protein
MMTAVECCPSVVRFAGARRGDGRPGEVADERSGKARSAARAEAEGFAAMRASVPVLPQFD